MADNAPDGFTPAGAGTTERPGGFSPAVGPGVAHLAPDGTFLAVNEAFTAVSGYSPSDLEGRSITAVLPSGPRSIDALFEALRTGRSDPPVADLPIETATGELVDCTSSFQSLDSTGEGPAGIVWTLRVPPVTPSPGVGAERESAIGKSFLALADAVPDGIIVLDTNSDIQYANPAVERILGHAPSELVGASKLRIIPERFRGTHLRALQRYLETGERNIDWSYVELSGQHAAGHEVPLGISLDTFTYGDERYFVGLFRDITPQKRAERALATRLAQQEAAARLGRHALRADAVDGLLEEAVEAVAAGLDAEYAKVLELTEDGRELLLRSGVGWTPGLVGSATISATADDSQAGHTLSESHPIIVEDLGTETRFSGPPLLTDHGVKSGISVTIGSADDPWGILGVHDTRRREFTEHDVHFVESIAHVLATAINRSRHTEQLELQRAQLLALDRLNALIHGIHQAIIKETSQSEIERSVCDGLIEKDTYRFAAIWHADPASGRVSPAAHAGHGAGYLDHATAATADDADPIDRALAEREPCVVPEMADAEPAAPWREEALARGYRSVAAIPIVYENVLFGVLGVYADTEGAFGGTVRAVLGILGETIGHAIATTNQERTLLSREKTALTLGIEGFGDVAGIDVEQGGFEVSSLVPVGDDRYLLYGEGGPGTEGLLAGLEGSELDVSVVSTEELGAGRVRFELTVADPPVLPLILAHGGRILEVTYRGPDLITTVELPPTVNVPQLTAEIEGIHPDLDVSLHKRRTRSGPAVSRADAFEGLTERQRAALETAFYSGYFEWPRESDGGAIASKLGVSSATFQQHFRVGQRKLLANLLEGS